MLTHLSSQFQATKTGQHCKLSAFRLEQIITLSRWFNVDLNSFEQINDTYCYIGHKYGRKIKASRNYVQII